MLSMDKPEAPTLAGVELPDDGIILVIGAYKGDTVKFINEHHPKTHIFAFEPQPWAYDELVKSTVTRFSMCVALGTENKKVILNEFGTDACTVMYMEGPRSIGDGVMMDAKGILQDSLGLRHVDLLLMNIEGYEYELLPYLLEFLQIDRILVQMHHRERFIKQLDDIHERLLRMEYSVQTLGGNWEWWTK